MSWMSLIHSENAVPACLIDNSWGPEENEGIGKLKVEEKSAVVECKTGSHPCCLRRFGLLAPATLSSPSIPTSEGGRDLGQGG